MKTYFHVFDVHFHDLLKTLKVVGLFFWRKVLLYLQLYPKIFSMELESHFFYDVFAKNYIGEMLDFRRVFIAA